MAAMLLFEIEIKRAPVPYVVYLLRIYCSMMQTSFEDSRSGMTNRMEEERIPWYPAFTAVPDFFIASALPASLYFEEYMHICTYMHVCTYLTANRLFTNCRCYQTILQWNISTQIGSGVKCWPDIYHWSPGLAMTGRISDIFLSLAQQPHSGPGPPHSRGF